MSIVGHRGSGKSTLAELLLKLREPTSGSIRLNGISLSEIDAAWLRQHAHSSTSLPSLFWMRRPLHLTKEPNAGCLTG
ncbi:ATP-binding cassette domain-containing protein [Paenibacillus sp. 1_12]|uniref:ATP-binding cassette domain-containing protein n=1 Tax=Paenibacillus sp. 1_12 TaxID=1566278 RepID=UPI0015A65895